jgi:hypothetical protein
MCFDEANLSELCSLLINRMRFDILFKCRKHLYLGARTIRFLENLVRDSTVARIVG